MASTKTTAAKLPDNFTPPWHLVTAEERIDDSLACVAMLAKQSLADIKEMAFKCGLPRQGPAWVYNEMIAKLLYQYGLVASEEKEVNSMAGLPYCAILQVDYNEDMCFGRNVLWAHFGGTDTQQAFHLIMDPSPNTPNELRITSAFGHLKLGPTFTYVEVTPRNDTVAAAKKGK